MCTTHELKVKAQYCQTLINNCQDVSVIIDICQSISENLHRSQIFLKLHEGFHLHQVECAQHINLKSKLKIKARNCNLNSRKESEKTNHQTCQNF